MRLLIGHLFVVIWSGAVFHGRQRGLEVLVSPGGAGAPYRHRLKEILNPPFYQRENVPQSRRILSADSISQLGSAQREIDIHLSTLQFRY